VLAESFEPVKALYQQVILLADAVRAHLAEVAASLEPANALRAISSRQTSAYYSMREAALRAILRYVQKPSPLQNGAGLASL